MRMKSNPGFAVATTAAMLFGSAVAWTAGAADSATMHCTGVNSCKGQSACKGASNSCKGQNSCKGKGFLELSKRACEDARAKAGYPK